MTRRLVLLRHAKSSWGDLDLKDHDRPLNARGRASCEAIGGWLAAQGHLPDQVLCSSAVRTRETWNRIAGLLPSGPQVQMEDRLYLANPETLADCLSRCTGQTVALLAHNPGIGEFAQQLVATPPAHPGFAPYPTLATLVVTFPIDDWSDLALGSGQVVDFIVPRDLTDL
ncbi:histidine phosphatase family protein [Pseudoruegeria sp. SK021]|uniref:SixA phosphatase family protein n=1 Tax=Pseudoruegeria sp. SK021 TaxID=1933035 RepID=UPI000A24AB64|nr:histidine phosphatase family protein [Pseudoruegeria sp. SK021]OSP55164.1 phosphoglycerate mutase [Pseudoruegeria sp. SK021]